MSAEDDERCECGADYLDVTLAHVLTCAGMDPGVAEVMAENTCRRVEGRRDLLPYPPREGQS